jgi:hypothetical protein
LVFKKNANYFAENWRKSPKIAENRDHTIDPLQDSLPYYEVMFGQALMGPVTVTVSAWVLLGEGFSKYFKICSIPHFFVLA